jgi:hypothetical protein
MPSAERGERTTPPPSLSRRRIDVRAIVGHDNGISAAT